MLSAEPKAKADNTYRDLDYSGCHKTRNYVLIVYYTYIVMKGITTNTPSHGTKFETALGNHALR